MRIRQPASLALIFLLSSLLLGRNSHRVVHAQLEPAGPAWPHLISESRHGSAAAGWSSQPAVSSDGRFVAFTSVAGNLVEGDRNGLADVFVRDAGLGVTLRVSRGFEGEDPNGWSYRPAISGDGRLVAFTSTASNLVRGDTNGSADVFVFDLLSRTTHRVSVSTENLQGTGWSDWASLSADGRYVAFSSSSPDLVQGDTNGLVDVYVHDRFTGQTRQISRTPGGGQLTDPASWEVALSADGRWAVFQVLTPDGAGRPGSLVLRNRVTGETRYAASGPGHLEALALSGNGGLALFQLRGVESSGSTATIHLYDAVAGQFHALPLPAEEGAPARGWRGALAAEGTTIAAVSDAAGEAPQILHRTPGGTWQSSSLSPAAGFLPLPGQPPALSGDGNFVALVAESESDSPAQVVLMPVGDPPTFLRRLGGRVTDLSGLPLRNVSLTWGWGRSVTTDREGYFSLAAPPDRTVVLRPAKEGFSFKPEEIRLEAGLEPQDLRFEGSPDELMAEAELDLGMPYSFHRGCDSELDGCGGPFHGFHAGYCTDLVLDAFRFGLDFNLQFALERDALIHPDHFYRWRNARNSHDMWRYFHYTSQMLPHDEAYLPGDVAFFDWDEDGIVDHVSLVSAVSASGRPKEMLDATGVIDFNPSGLAAELTWELFHENTVLGHGRWLGSFGPGYYEPGTGGQALQIAVDSLHVQAELIDEAGRILSAAANQSSLSAASQAAIPGGRYFDNGLGEVLSVLNPQDVGHTYLLRLTASQESVYHLRVHLLEGGRVLDASGYAQLSLAAGQTHQIGIALHDGPGLKFDLLPLR